MGRRRFGDGFGGRFLSPDRHRLQRRISRPGPLRAANDLRPDAGLVPLEERLLPARRSPRGLRLRLRRLRPARSLRRTLCSALRPGVFIAFAAVPDVCARRPLLELRRRQPGRVLERKTGIGESFETIEERAPPQPIRQIERAGKTGRETVTFQDRGHGNPTDRITMTFFIAPRSAVSKSTPLAYHDRRRAHVGLTSRRSPASP